ncbi:hypothetical protein OG601_33830 [Streptomyces sp. NBC_01239]|uniref:hypothetical protein n=1 Tax=Streptomyces sp. NBC_01239 TaxID=2903792 RepID=UPI0022582092|nr:hypothetical protein [Streptomyces sp. NBC_01239]MCX4815591.1 hypothetical protein [Streptomyces sp. NBC_01239]
MAAAEEARASTRGRHAHYRKEALPVPAFWPYGRDHFEPRVFVATGVLAIDLHNDRTPQETPAMAVLTRQKRVKGSLPEN